MWAKLFSNPRTQSKAIDRNKAECPLGSMRDLLLEQYITFISIV